MESTNTLYEAVSQAVAFWRPQWRCTWAWHVAHSVIKFSSESSPEWLRNSLW